MKSIILDPTVLNTKERLTSFIESRINEEYQIFLPSLISGFIQNEKWDDLVSLLRGWEWNLARSKSEEWFRSSNFKNLCIRINEVCISFEKVREELSSEEKELLSLILEIIKYDSPKLVELAKELITIAITKKAGIFSYTRHLKRWLMSLRRVVILDISERTNVLSEAKADIKYRIRNTRWWGKVFVIFLNITTALALTSIFPTAFNWAIGTTLAELGEHLIVGLVTDGY